MANLFKQFMSGEITISADSWHYQIYQWWKNHGGSIKSNYRENLCHYMRVLMIWVPLFWFFLVPLYKWIRPWMVAAGLVWGIVLWQAGAPVRVTLYLATLLALMAISLILNEKGVQRFADRWFAPPLEWVWEHGLKSTLVWFLTTGWLVTIAVLFGVAIWFGGTRFLLFIAFAIALIVALALFILGLAWICATVDTWLKHKIPSKPRQPKQPKQRGSSTLKVVVHYLAAKKHKICPWINLPPEDKEPEDEED